VNKKINEIKRAMFDETVQEIMLERFKTAFKSSARFVPEVFNWGLKWLKK
jgi:hypothetical protein